ncbi:hypothetical protein ACJMQP_11660 [Rhodopseudomonas palustris]
MKHLWYLPALLLAACSNLPQTERVGEFGKATTAALAFAKDSITANRTIALRTNDENLAVKYIKGKVCPQKDEAGYDDKCKDDSFQLLAAPENVLPSDLTGARVRALTALGEYGDALAKAADQGQIDKLENAAARLGDAAASLTAAFPPASPAVAPAVKIAFRGFGFFLGSTYAAEINDIVRQTNPHVQEVTRMLEKDFAGLHKLLTAQAKTYDTNRKSSLAAVRDKGDIDRLRLYAEFKTARQEVAAVVLLSQAAKNFSGIFREMADAHQLLSQGDPNAEIALRRLLALMNEATELVKAVQAERKS